LDDTRKRPAVRSVITWLTEICREHAAILLSETPPPLILRAGAEPQ
jgi:hypothetical protein